MKAQETREIITSGIDPVKNNEVWFKPQMLYILLGMVLLIALVGAMMAPSGKRDANDIISPWDNSLVPPQVPDRTAIVLQSKPQALPASQGAGAKDGSESSGGRTAR